MITEMAAGMATVRTGVGAGTGVKPGTGHGVAVALGMVM